MKKFAICIIAAVSFVFVLEAVRPWAVAGEGAEGGEKKIALTLWQLPNQTRSQMMSYILRADDGQVVVIDGGTVGDADYLAEQIKAIRPDGRVSAWFLTHLHSDHVEALCKIMTEKKSGLTIDCVYFHFPPMEWFEKNCGAGEQKEAKFFYDALPSFTKTETPQPGQRWTFGSVTIEALNDFDPAITANRVNNTSIVYRAETPNRAILFLGDLGVEGGNRLAKILPPEKLKADGVQTAHHGQNGVNRDFYVLVAPSLCLWCAPDWLWNNNNGGGDGSGPWKTIQTRSWLDDLGVKKHYVIKDGLIQLDFE